MGYLSRYRLANKGGYHYKIPFNEMSADISEEVISYLKGGEWALFRDRAGNYILQNISNCSVSWSLSVYEELVRGMCKKYQIQPHMLVSLSLPKYFSNTLIQKIIDALLQRGYSDSVRYGGVCLGLAMRGGKLLYLVEVLGRG